jgi:cytochrome c553
MSIRLSVVTLMLALGMPVLGADQDRNYEYCTVCHGTNGNGNPAIQAPRIAGLEPWYLKSQFAAFRSGWRGAHPDDAPGNEMRPVAEALTATEIDQAIAYVGTLVPKAAEVTMSGDVANGKTIYAACAACHGAQGQGNQSLHAPGLAMRTDWYLATQLRNYRAGLRGTKNADVNGRQMRAMAASLRNEEAIMDVVAYIDTLR